MRKHYTMQVLALLVIMMLIGCSNQPDVGSMSEAELNEYARGIHDRVITIDTHDDIPFNFATQEVDPADPASERQITLPKMREGGLDVGFFVVYVGQGKFDQGSYDSMRDAEGNEFAYGQAILKFDAIHRMTEQMYPDQIELAYTADDVERINASGKLVAVICMENGWSIGNDLSKIQEFHDRGARYITLAHGGHNDICDSATPRSNEPEAEHNGVSEFGKQVITEMNRVGIMVDVSHISKKSMIDACTLSKAPVILSHSGIDAINEHARNIDDEQLLALKKNGGVIQCVALSSFVKSRNTPEREEAVSTLRDEFNIPLISSSAAIQALSEERRNAYNQKLAEIDEQFPQLPAATVEDYVNHIDHVVNLIGIDHVAISSDFDGGGGIVGWEDASKTFNVTLELVKRGYSEEDIAKIWGGNTLRIWREAERVSAEIKGGEDN